MGHITLKDTVHTDLKSDLVKFPPISLNCQHGKNWQALPELTLEDGSSLGLYAVSQLSDVKQVWKQFQRTAWHTPFQDFDWVNSWFECKDQGLDAKPLIILGYKQQELQFILPFSSETSFGLKRLLWMANEVNDYNCPLIRAEFLPKMTKKSVREIYAAIGRYETGIDIFYLTKQPKTLAGFANPFLEPGARQSSCDSHLLSLNSPWTALFARQRSAKSRRRLEQKARRLKRNGNLRFRLIRDAQQRQVCIDSILHWKSVQLEQKGDRNPFDKRSHDPLSGPVLTHTIKKFADVDTTASPLRVYGLFLDDRMIAGLIAFVEARTFSLFTMSYGPEVFPNCSAGTILLVKTIELASRAKFHIYDFLAGDEPYKLAWCDQRLELYDCIFAGTTIGRLGVFSKIARLEIKKSLKSNAPAMAALKKANRSRFRLLSFFKQ